MHRPHQTGVRETKFDEVMLESDGHQTSKKLFNIVVARNIREPPSLRPGAGCPCAPQDFRHIVLTHMRGIFDGLVVEHNPTISALVRCNNCAIKLSNAGSARVTQFYLADYLSKNPHKNFPHSPKRKPIEFIKVYIFLVENRRK